MDKKLYPTLDPKIKEVYDRVMGLSLATSPLAPSSPQKPVEKPVTQTISYQPSSNTTPQPAKPPVPPTAPATTTFTATAGTIASSSGAKIKNSTISPAILIVLGLVFFFVYALFWMKLFNLPVPFLP